MKKIRSYTSPISPSFIDPRFFFLEFQPNYLPSETITSTGSYIYILFQKKKAQKPNFLKIEDFIHFYFRSSSVYQYKGPGPGQRRAVREILRNLKIGLFKGNIKGLVLSLLW